MTSWITIAILCGISLFFIIIVSKGVKIVRQAETMIVERLGKYSRTLESGVNIIWPIIDKPRQIMWMYVREGIGGKTGVVTSLKPQIDLRETVYDFPKQNVITRDNVVTEINALLYFQITDPVRAVYEIANLPNAIEKLTQTTLRNVLGEMDLDEMLTSRDTINSKLRIILDEATDKWGVKVNRVELQDINPPEDIRDAMEKQMRAERDRRAVILVAEGNKKSSILEAEGSKEAEINKAEGEKRALILAAEGEAEALMRTTQAEANAIDLLSRALSSTGGDPTGYIIALRYIDALKEMVSGVNTRTVFLPYEATGILGALGGIKDLLSSEPKPSPYTGPSSPPTTKRNLPPVPAKTASTGPSTPTAPPARPLPPPKQEDR